MRSYYKTNAPNQMRGIMTNPVLGLDEYTPANSINDNNVSDLLDVEPFQNSALLFHLSPTSNTNILASSTNREGEIKEITAINGYVPSLNLSMNGYAALVFEPTSGLWYIKHIRDSLSTVITQYGISSIGLPLINLSNYLVSLLWTATNVASIAYPSTGCVFTANAQDGGISSSHSVVTGHKYCLLVSANNPAANAAHFKWSKTGQSGDIYSASTGNIILSDVFTANSTGALTISFVDNRASGWNAVTAYYINMIDVTNETLSDADIKTYYGAYGYVDNATGFSSLYVYDSCIFNTLEKQYICFTCSRSKRLYYFNYTDLNTGYVELPFYPKKIISHASRVFAIDTDNAVWGSSAGDMFSWYSNEYDDDAIMTTTNMQLGAYGSLVQPVTPRPFTATVTTVGAADTMGTLTVVGTNTLDNVQTEIITPVSGQRVQGLMIFKTYTSITGAGWVINGTADTITFGIGPSNGYVVDDEVYWPIERETKLSEICVLSENLYIFCDNSVYVLSGYSPDTFTLTRLLVDIGIANTGGIDIPSRTARKHLTVSNNIAYFFYNGDIYEFDGSNIPRLISHPEYVNNNNVNGIYGGIDNLESTIQLASDSNHLYLYDPTDDYMYVNGDSDDGTYFLQYNITDKTWWKYSEILDKTYDTSRFMVPNANNTNIVIVINSFALISPIYYFKFYYTSHTKFQVKYPYIITKAFNSNTSEVQTLTSLLLEVKKYNLNTSTINIYYSTTADGDDFVLFKTYTAYAFSGDVEILDIPMPVALIPNKHHYRIKIEVNGSMYLFNIERRYRVRGRSR